MDVNKPYRKLVEQITAFHPEMKTDRKKFSDYLIYKVIGDFITDQKGQGKDDDDIQSNSRKLYFSVMEAWEEQFEKFVKEEKDADQRSGA